MSRRSYKVPSPQAPKTSSVKHPILMLYTRSFI